MTRREKQLIRESFHIIREDAGPLSQLFYGRLFELEPRARAMFHGDIGRQGLKLMEMMAAVVSSLNRFDAMTPALQAMGQRHVAYGVLPHHYGMVEDAFLWAVGQDLSVPSGSEVLEAWRTLIRDVSTVMLAGAGQVKAASRPESGGQ